MTLALTAGEKGAPAGADVAEYRKSKIAEAEAFAADSGSYLITSAAALDAYPQYEVIRQTEEFSLLYNP